MDLSGNALSRLPGELLAACPALNELRLRQNRIAGLEDLAVAAGSGLCVLDVEGNAVREVPPWLPAALPRLRTLMLANNEVGPTLPPELGFWESLQSVTLAGNPLRGIRQGLLLKGWQTVAPFLRDRLPEGAPRSVVVPAARPRTPPGYYAPASRGPAGPPAASPYPGAAAVAAGPSRPPTGADFGRQSVGQPPRRPQGPPAAQSGPPRQPAGPPQGPPAAQSGPPWSSGDLAAAQLERLSVGVQALEQELSAPGLSRSRQSALSHSLRMKRAELLKAEREVQRAAAVVDGLG